MHRLLARVAVSAAFVALSACASNPVGETAAPAAKPAAKTAAKAPAPGKTAAATQPSQQQALANAIAAASVSLEAELARAHTLREQGNYPEATKVLGQLVLVAPDDARVVAEYGKVLVQQGGRADDAIAFLKRAVVLNGKDASLYSALGVAYDQADDSKAAKAAYEKALALHPGDVAVLNNYAVSRMLAHDYDGAQKLLAQAQAAGASNPKVASNLQLLVQLRGSKAAAPAIAAKVATQKPASPATAAASKIAPPAGPKNLLPGNAAQPTTVVMQQVPADSHAGPSHPASAPAHKIAAAKPKPAKPTAAKLAKSEVPALRTAD